MMGGEINLLVALGLLVGLALGWACAWHCVAETEPAAPAIEKDHRARARRVMADALDAVEAYPWAADLRANGDTWNGALDVLAAEFAADERGAA